MIREVGDAYVVGLTFDQLASDLGVQPDSLRVRIDRLELRSEVDAYYPRKHKGPVRSRPTGRLCHKGHPLVNTPHSVWWPWCPTCQKEQRAQKRVAA